MVRKSHQGWVLGWAAALVLGAASVAHAGEFDARGVLQFSPDALFTEGFQDPTAAAAQGVQLLDRNYNRLPSSAVALSAYFTTDGTPLEGFGAMHIVRMGFQGGGPAYVAVPLPPMTGMVEVRAWSRAAKSPARLYANYLVEPGSDYSFVTLAAVATGRRTSDAWIEYTTGPIPASVMGRPLSQVLFSAQFGDITLDALEVLPAGPIRVPEVACTLADVSTACGVYGECIYGQCVDATLVWGVVPPTLKRRQDYVARLQHVFTRLHANREAVINRGASFSQRLAALSASDSPRVFWGGIQAAVNHFRDGHTSPPVNIGSFYSSVPSSLSRQGSGALGVCLGLTDLDLRGGELGYTVFNADPAAGVAGADLQVGDILDKVDGEDVPVFIQRMLELSASLGSDPLSDPAFMVHDLPAILSTRAAELQFLRCESASSCTQPTTVTIDVGQRIRTRMGTTGHVLIDFEPIHCDGRFTHSVETLAPPDPDGNDVISSQLRDGIMSVEFDGFSGEDAWDNGIATALVANPDRILIDTRLGNGGYIDRVAYLVSRLRDSTSPQSAFGTNRPWNSADADPFYEGLLDCFDAGSQALFDRCSQTISFETAGATASAGTARVAWINTADISGNDFAPQMLKGRAGLRVFGPVSTAGAFGAIVTLPPLLASEYYGGSIQVHDTRFAASRAELPNAPFASGTGVTPDEVSVQRLSDSLGGVDTMLERARAWLQEMP